MLLSLFEITSYDEIVFVSGLFGSFEKLGEIFLISKNEERNPFGFPFQFIDS